MVTLHFLGLEYLDVDLRGDVFLQVVPVLDEQSLLTIRARKEYPIKMPDNRRCLSFGEVGMQIISTSEGSERPLIVAWNRV